MVAIEIRPRDSSFAKTCPHRVQLDVLQPCEPLPDPPFLQMLFRAGDKHEDDTFAALFDGVEGAVVIDAEDLDAREWQTMQAVQSGTLVIAGGRLTVDHESHRVGQPDLLVRHDGGYLPIEVKSHKALDRVRKEGTGTALVSDLTTPFLDAAVTDTERNARRHLGDLMQLAHYYALLDAAGIASPGWFVAGVCGTEGVIVWHDLSEPNLPPPDHVDGDPDVCLSALARYNFEFTDRLEEVSDLSLISGVGAGRRSLYKAYGINDLHDLAGLDWRTAALVRDKVDVEGLLAKVAGKPSSTPLAGVIANRPKQVEALAALGLLSVGDLEAIDARTLEVCTAGAANAAGQIELARARVGTAPAYRKRGVDVLTVPRADIEIDVDMENINDGCYLWGALVTDRRVGDVGARYIAFTSWDPDIEAGEQLAFKEFWSWLTGERAKAAAEGATFRAYCYSKSAENGQMTRIADRLGLRAEVDEFIASEDWVDLLEVVRRQLITGRSMGLKETAPLAGFSWRAGDGAGTLAIVKYEQAVDEEADAAARAAAQQW